MNWNHPRLRVSEAQFQCGLNRLNRRPIFFAQSMLAFGQYEMKSSEASRLSVSQFKCGLNRLNRHNFLYMLLNWLSNLLRNEDIATG